MNTTAANEITLRLKLALHEHLERIKQPINEEIRNYPLPAAGCDAQYNHLIEQRGQLAKEISLLDKIDMAPALGEFVDASAFLDEETIKLIKDQMASIGH